MNQNKQDQQKIKIPPLIRNSIAYLLALAIVWRLSRGIHWAELLQSFKQANMALFLIICTVTFMVWFLGETLLYSRLFSYFHSHTSFREMLPISSAMYFLQVVNAVLAGSAFALFIQRRKGVPWLESGCTMLFQGLLDIQIMALMALLAVLFFPATPLHVAWYYPGIIVAACWLFAGFWMKGRPSSRFGLWIYERPSMSSFRKAKPSHYFRLMLLRAPIFVVQGFALYLCMECFGIHVPLSLVLAFTPVVLLITSLPITPLGIGSEQAAIVLGLGAFASKSSLLAVSLAMSSMTVIFRLVLGLGSAGTVARDIVGA